MAYQRVRSNTGQEFILGKTNMREIGSSYFAVVRSALKNAFTKVNRLSDISKSDLVIENLGPTSSIVVRRLLGFWCEPRRKVRYTWTLRSRGDGAVLIGCKLFQGANAVAIKNWAKQL